MLTLKLRLMNDVTKLTVMEATYMLEGIRVCTENAPNWKWVTETSDIDEKTVVTYSLSTDDGNWIAVISIPMEEGKLYPAQLDSVRGIIPPRTGILICGGKDRKCYSVVS